MTLRRGRNFARHDNAPLRPRTTSEAVSTANKCQAIRNGGQRSPGTCRCVGKWSGAAKCQWTSKVAAVVQMTPCWRSSPDSATVTTSVLTTSD